MQEHSSTWSAALLVALMLGFVLDTAPGFATVGAAVPATRQAVPAPEEADPFLAAKQAARVEALPAQF
ncbi:hypothetical protein [Caenimonas aquaedulcis]|uniref:Uncharacterized protein n=1 Tax=Caenimonas aquaedulcis TaxID=2793270 RepID=A0A931MJ88_9BURK|nr:hypothetical protein [Caenimonas aquaedulcis]MBG9390528.1 hypothetical protein [Caenimonas aquaedulcis]